MATLRQFLETGHLGPIHPGMSEADVIALLGPPPDKSIARHPQILKYGGLQLTFLKRPNATDRELAHIGLYYVQPEEPIPAPARPADFDGTSTTTLSEVRESLVRVGSKDFEVVEGDDTSYLIFPSGARIAFDGQKLCSIHFAAPSSKSAKKQVSVSISEDTWSQLRSLALESKRSVSELCAELIARRATKREHENAGGVTTR